MPDRFISGERIGAGMLLSGGAEGHQCKTPAPWACGIELGAVWQCDCGLKWIVRGRDWFERNTRGLSQFMHEPLCWMTVVPASDVGQSAASSDEGWVVSQEQAASIMPVLLAGGFIKGDDLLGAVRYLGGRNVGKPFDLSWLKLS